MIVRGRAEPREAGRAPATKPASSATLIVDIAGRTARPPDVRFTGPTAGLTFSDSVNPDTFPDLVGGPAFLRIARHDGRSEIVAAEIKSIDGRSITLGKFEVDAAHRLRGSGDDFWVHVPKEPGAEPVITLGPDDAITTAVPLPLHVGTTPRSSGQRVDIRSHAQAVLDGTAQPKHDLEDVKMTASAAADVKAEQNAIVLALSRPLTEMFAASARIQGITDDVAESSRPFAALEQSMLELSTHTTNRFVRGLVRDDGPLGKAWARLGAVHAFAQAHLPAALPSNNPTRLLDQGMWTAIEIVGRLAEVADAFAARTGKKGSDILRASLPLVVKMAATHQKVLHSILAGVEEGATDEGRWSPEHFRLVDGRLELTPELIAHVAETRGARFDALPSRTTGCPAAQSLNGASAVKLFVELYAELVAKLEARGAV